VTGRKDMKGGENMSSDDFFDDLETEDFAIIGGVIGLAEEEAREIKRIEKEDEPQDPLDTVEDEDPPRDPNPEDLIP